jgi:hypothetical protein
VGIIAIKIVAKINAPINPKHTNNAIVDLVILVALLDFFVSFAILSSFKKI